MFTARNVQDLNWIKNHYSASYKVSIIGYSYGAVLASQVSAPRLLISIPISYLWFFVGYEHAKSSLKQGDHLVMGDVDEFSTSKAFEEFTSGLDSISKLIPNCNHFYTTRASMIGLLEFVNEFLSNLQD